MLNQSYLFYSNIALRILGQIVCQKSIGILNDAKVRAVFLDWSGMFVLLKLVD